MKSEVRKRFEDAMLHDMMQKHPILAAEKGGAVFAKPKYAYHTANGLTRAIIDFIELNGGQAERVTVTGRPYEVRGVGGRCVGVGWQKSHMTVGTADISATIGGQSVKIEVKIGRDRQSEAQRRYQRNIERAGGLYYVARNFEDFVSWFNRTWSVD